MENNIKGYNVVFISGTEAQYRDDYRKVFIGKVISEWFQATDEQLREKLAGFNKAHNTPIEEMEVVVLK